MWAYNGFKILCMYHLLIMNRVTYYHNIILFSLIDSLNSNSNNIVLIGSVSAVIIVCIMATITLVAIVLYRKGEHLVVVDFWSLSVSDDDDSIS